ncbi:hypothetical protein EYF80_016081 [Liparis tanakae]|uniref:Uncharacterized protein n=1 Tax=Liparis tanakae TaxID=230148 RepID=A0A4Z2I7F1_9TELE|nr:hypothetical protein EYF80_016081 [Liparis tanakae]
MLSDRLDMWHGICVRRTGSHHILARLGHNRKLRRVPAGECALSAVRVSSPPGRNTLRLLFLGSPTPLSHP